jgi:hypothetical protein
MSEYSALVRAPQVVDSGLSQKRNGALRAVFFYYVRQIDNPLFFGGFFNRSAFTVV